MDQAIQIAENAYWVGSNDRETTLFESVWPLPRGVCYNSYLITGEQNVLIDTVKSCYFDQYLNHIEDLIGEKSTIDYLVINHMEPDHSGSIKLLQRLYPEMKLICNPKTVPFLKNFYEIEDQLIIIKDGESMSIGGTELSFHFIPMVHWPETMVTYDKKSKVLYTCDAFGGFGALEGGIFDDQVDVSYFENEILRYYSNIVGKYSPMVQRALGKLGSLDIKTIAPSHGPIWRSNVKCIIDLYDRWSKCEAEEGIVLVYGTMYGNTLKVMEEIARGIADKQFTTVRVHNISDSHPSYILTDIWRYKGVIMGAPTYNMSLFPPMEYLTNLLENKMLKDRIMGVFGNYSWSGVAVKRLTEFAEKLKWQTVQPIVEVQSAPTKEDFANAYALGQTMVDEIRASDCKPHSCSI